MSKILQKEFAKVMGYVSEICDILESADEYRALVALKALKQREKKLQGYIDEVTSLLDVDNIGNAILKIKARRMGAPVYPDLPEELTRIPEIWFLGLPPCSKYPKGVAPLTVWQAERKYMDLEPKLKQVWQIASSPNTEGGEDNKREILEWYEKLPPDELAMLCYGYVNQYDLQREETKIETATTNRELNKVLNSLRPDYGVVRRDEQTPQKETL